ncbi:unnamed protein product [Dracunculus medinensis]|uniref:Receptor-mediated endocytosis protein 6 n=1 Tax=Dracunculus medinensis TaxID=318479 RepID=A0A0N4U6C5_DRAME|nr:unnamed protein product [Dracunculus medinensis]
MECCNGQDNSLATLCERLRSEKLLVASELENLQRLNEQIEYERNTVAQLAWVGRQEQIILSKLINSHPSVIPENCCMLVAQLESASFLEGYHRIDGQHYANAANLLNLLYSSAITVAQLLHATDKIQKKDNAINEEFVHCVFSFLYGCCSFPADERRILEVLSHLMRLQIISQNDPRLVLRKGNTSFCRLYRLFSEDLHVAKVFLTAALHDSVMYLLSHDEIFLDIEPSKSVLRFPREERRIRFGEDENSLSYLQNLTAHRSDIEARLLAISSRIMQSMTCFPPALSWLVRHLHTSLIKKNISQEQSSLICTDLIFTHLICPAIANPETIGVIADTPISYIARFNLMQVGQILQTLAVAPFERPPSHLEYFYSQFDQNSMARVVQFVLESNNDSLDSLYPPINTDSNGTEQFVRHVFAGTVEQLNCLVGCFCISVLSVINSNALEDLEDNDFRYEIFSLRSRLPCRFSANRSDLLNSQKATATKHNDSPKHSMAHNSFRQPKLRNFAVQFAAHRVPHRSHSQPIVQDICIADHGNMEVLLFPLGENREPLGLCSEEKFMESVQQRVAPRKHKLSDSAGEKRTRFVDTESIDRTTDGGTDDEEAPSLSSSIDGNVDGMDDDGEISTLPDNFSDVMASSANISGRVSPSVSDPISVGGQEQNQAVDQIQQPRRNRVLQLANTSRRINTLNLPVAIRRENSEGLEEQFGKFGLPQQENRNIYRDETHSLISENWSTDVLPSDTEGFGVDVRAEGNNAPVISNLQPPGANVPPVPVLPVVAEANEMTTPGISSGTLTVAPVLEDRSDTWSVDAMASDSEADPSHRTDDLLMIDDTDGIDRGSGTSGGNNTPMLASVGSQSSMVAGGSAATHSRDQASELDRSVRGKILSTEQSADKQELSSGSGHIPSNREQLRRQSSGSSFYSKSDVESEFSNIRDLNDDALSFILGDYVPSFRNSIGELQLPSSPAASVLAVAGSFCNDDIDGSSSKDGQVRERSLSPSKSEQPTSVQTPSTETVQDEPLTVEEIKLDTDHSKGQVDLRSENTEIKPEIAENQVKPQKFRDSFDVQARKGLSAAVGGNSSVKKKMNIFYGLQKVGESLKMRKGIAVSSLRQSLSQATTMSEIASVSSTSDARSRNANQKFIKEAVRKELIGNSSSRLTESRSLNELNRTAEINRQTAEEILNKYKGRLPSSQYILKSIATHKDTKNEKILSELYYDPNNLLQCRAFLDVKRKLRLVLSSFGSVPGTSYSDMTFGDNLALQGQRQLNSSGSQKSDSQKLVDFLQILLAESINAQDKALSAQIREVLRCLSSFEEKGVRKLLRTLKDEHRRRTAYLLYLQQSRLILLQLRSYLDKLTNQLRRQKLLTDECLVEVLVGFYLQQRREDFFRFIEDFKLLEAQDERTDAVECLLQTLYELLPNEKMWRYAGDERLTYVRKSIERALMARIYKMALFPNGEADQSRDSVFHKSIGNLAQVISPDHPELNIPKRFHGECPWPSAQAEIAIINAYKTPRDKMTCIIRCCETIQNLIMLAAQQNTVSADDITPVLVYVLIQANPRALLSNIQYISEFYGKRMEGAEAYWWAQFTSAVEFIKTLLNRHF